MSSEILLGRVRETIMMAAPSEKLFRREKSRPDHLESGVCVRDEMKITLEVKNCLKGDIRRVGRKAGKGISVDVGRRAKVLWEMCV